MKELACHERDELLIDRKTELVGGDWAVESSLTDHHGEFGEPRIETTWVRGETRVQDVRHPSPEGGADAAPCEHWTWEGDRS